MAEFLSEINWSPLWISLKTGLAATVIAFFLGIFFARKIMGHPFDHQRGYHTGHYGGGIYDAFRQ